MQNVESGQVKVKNGEEGKDWERDTPTTRRERTTVILREAKKNGRSYTLM